MVDNETMISSVCGSLEIEGFHVPESTRSIMRDCASGIRSFDEAVSHIVKQHSGAADE